MPIPIPHTGSVRGAVAKGLAARAEDMPALGAEIQASDDGAVSFADALLSAASTTPPVTPQSDAAPPRERETTTARDGKRNEAQGDDDSAVAPASLSASPYALALVATPPAPLNTTPPTPSLRGDQVSGADSVEGNGRSERGSLDGADGVGGSGPTDTSGTGAPDGDMPTWLAPSNRLSGPKPITWEPHPLAIGPLGSAPVGSGASLSAATAAPSDATVAPQGEQDSAPTQLVASHRAPVAMPSDQTTLAQLGSMGRQETPTPAETRLAADAPSASSAEMEQRSGPMDGLHLPVSTGDQPVAGPEKPPLEPRLAAVARGNGSSVTAQAAQTPSPVATPATTTATKVSAPADLPATTQGGPLLAGDAPRRWAPSQGERISLAVVAEESDHAPQESWQEHSRDSHTSAPSTPALTVPSAPVGPHDQAMSIHAPNSIATAVPTAPGESGQATETQGQAHLIAAMEVADDAAMTVLGGASSSTARGSARGVDDVAAAIDGAVEVMRAASQRHHDGTVTPPPSTGKPLATARDVPAPTDQARPWIEVASGAARATQGQPGHQPIVASVAPADTSLTRAASATTEQILVSASGAAILPPMNELSRDRSRHSTEGGTTTKTAATPSHDGSTMAATATITATQVPGNVAAFMAAHATPSSRPATLDTHVGAREAKATAVTSARESHARGAAPLASADPTVLPRHMVAPSGSERDVVIAPLKEQAGDSSSLRPIVEGIFVRQAALRATPSSSSFHVVLQPHALGMVTVHVERGEAGLRVTLVPQRAETQMLLDKHLPELVSQLSTSGDAGALQVSVVAPGAQPHGDATTTAATTMNGGAAQLGQGFSPGAQGRQPFDQPGAAPRWDDVAGGTGAPAPSPVTLPRRGARGRAGGLIRAGTAGVDLQA